MREAITSAVTTLLRSVPSSSFLTARKRRKLWEVAPVHLCAVVGTCLPLPELRRLARRAALENAATASDYALHRSAVRHARERNELSRLMHKTLDRCHSGDVQRCCAAGEGEALRTLWKASLEAGEVAGPLWALMTHPAATEALLEEVSQDVHMLSHQAGASARADLRRLARLEHENAELRAQLAEQASHHAGLIAGRDLRLEGLQRRLAALAGLEHRLEQSQARLAAAAQAPGGDARRSLELATLRAQRAEQALAGARGMQSRIEALQEALAQAQRETHGAEQALAELLARPDAALASAVPSPRGALLFGRSVLYVGGLTGMVEHYRAAVERFGARFLHHDGGQEDAAHRLPTLIAGADAVVCASGAVSHNACHAVKRACKHSGKPCALLRQASLSSFVHALNALAGGEVEIGAIGTILERR